MKIAPKWGNWFTITFEKNIWCRYTTSMRTRQLYENEDTSFVLLIIQLNENDVVYIIDSYFS